MLSEAQRPADDKAGDEATEGDEQIARQASDDHHGQHEARNLRDKGQTQVSGQSRWGVVVVRWLGVCVRCAPMRRER